MDRLDLSVSSCVMFGLFKLVDNFVQNKFKLGADWGRSYNIELR